VRVEVESVRGHVPLLQAGVRLAGTPTAGQDNIRGKQVGEEFSKVEGCV
jgi:hypothetical protein